MLRGPPIAPDSPCATLSRCEILAGTSATGDIAQTVWSSNVIQSGLLASRPAAAAGNAGFLYYATDTDDLWRSDGATWVKVSTGGTVTSAEITDGTIAAADIAAGAESATPPAGGTVYTS